MKMKNKVTNEEKAPRSQFKETLNYWYWKRLFASRSQSHAKPRRRLKRPMNQKHQEPNFMQNEDEDWSYAQSKSIKKPISYKMKTTIGITHESKASRSQFHAKRSRELKLFVNQNRQDKWKSKIVSLQHRVLIMVCLDSLENSYID